MDFKIYLPKYIVRKKNYIFKRYFTRQYYGKKYGKELFSAINSFGSNKSDLIEMLSFPKIGAIEINSTCNLKCKICNTHLANRKVKIMDLEKIEKILSTLKHYDVQGLVLHTINEPFAHPEFENILKLFKRYDIYISRLSTNGLLLDKHSNAIFKYNDIIKTLRFSIDGIYEQYEKTRQGASFQKLVDNIRSFSKENKKVGIPLRIDSVLLKDNLYQVREFLSFFSKFFLFEDIHLHHSNFLAADNSYIKNQSILYNHMKEQNPCLSLYTAVFILSNGDISLCCRDFAAQLVIGNIFEQSIEEIWNGQRHKEIIEKFKKKSKDLSQCLNCFSADSNYEGLLIKFIYFLYFKYYKSSDKDFYDKLKGWVDLLNNNRREIQKECIDFINKM